MQHERPRVVVRGADFTNEQVVNLLRLHTAWCSAPENNVEGGVIYNLDVSALQKPGIDVFVAWDEASNTALGCIGILTLTSGKQVGGRAGELKSMHVAAAARGQGVAGALLNRVVERAKELDHSALFLETGTTEPFSTARKFYERQGFRYCDSFADYVPGTNNTFMTKTL
jgi:putative acetyltransferase